MASTGVNVLRWSSLGLGVFYGIYHQQTIKSADRQATIQADYNRKQDLIQDAKKAFAAKNAPSDSGNSAILNPEDPSFDLEKYLQKVAADNP